MKKNYCLLNPPMSVYYTLYRIWIFVVVVVVEHLAIEILLLVNEFRLFSTFASLPISQVISTELCGIFLNSFCCKCGCVCRTFDISEGQKVYNIYWLLEKSWLFSIILFFLFFFTTNWLCLYILNYITWPFLRSILYDYNLYTYVQCGRENIFFAFCIYIWIRIPL